MRILFCKIIIKFGKHQKNKYRVQKDTHTYIVNLLSTKLPSRIQWGKEHMFFFVFFVYLLTNSARTTRHKYGDK